MTELCFDLETTGTNPLKHDFVGVGYKWDDKPIEYSTDVNIPYFNADALVGHNIKFDLEFLIAKGICKLGTDCTIFDTQVAEWLLFPDQLKYGLKYLAKKYFNEENTTFGDLINKYKPKGKKKRECNITVVPPEEIAKYCKMDISMTYRLYKLLKPKLIEHGLWDLFQMEMEFLKVLIDMELKGANISTTYLGQLDIKYSQMIEEIKIHIYSWLPEFINIDSPKQLSEILFGWKNVIEHCVPYEPPRKEIINHRGIINTQIELKFTSKTNIISVDDGTLSRLREAHPIVPLLIEYRTLTKLKRTYASALPKSVYKGKVYTEYLQARTATGRLASKNPNLQNIPKKNKDIRKAFVASPNYVLLSADYKQMELWIIAFLAGDKRLMNDLESGKDIYVEVAKDMMGISEVLEEQREISKTIVLGVNYGRTKWGLSKALKIDEETASNYIFKYFGRYNGVSMFMKFAPILAKERGYILSILGRKRWYKGLENLKPRARDRCCINTPIQSSGADIMKLAMIEIYKLLTKYNMKSKMILQIHDEVVLHVYKPELSVIKDIVKRCMEKVTKDLGIPIPVELSKGKNWAEMEVIE